MRYRHFFYLFLIPLLGLGGCGPQLSQSDLGTVVFELPQVAGAEEPYKMPQLGPPLDDKDKPRGPRLR